MVFQVLTKHQMLFRQFYNPLFDTGVQIQTIVPMGPIDVVQRDTYVCVLCKQYLISYLNESWVLKTLFIKKVLFLWSHIHHGIYPPKMISIYNERIPYIIQVGICFFLCRAFFQMDSLSSRRQRTFLSVPLGLLYDPAPYLPQGF